MLGSLCKLVQCVVVEKSGGSEGVCRSVMSAKEKVKSQANNLEVESSASSSNSSKKQTMISMKTGTSPYRAGQERHS